MKLKTTLCIFLLFFISKNAQSESGFPKYLSYLNNQSQIKESSRWTIEGWLSQKQRVRLMDQWLAMNTNELGWELNLSADQWGSTRSISINPDSESKKTISDYKFSFFYKLIGISASLSNLGNSVDSNEFLFHLRLLGSSMQSSQFEVFGGVKKNDDSLGVYPKELTIYGGLIEIYLLNFIGTNVSYKNFLENQNSLSQSVSGSQLYYGLFIDVSFLRIYGGIQVEDWKFGGENSQVPYTIHNNGTKFGLSFYF